MNEQKKSAPLLSDRAADRDLLDFSPYTNTLLDIIRDPATEGPLVIGLFGTWGSGKTSLMKFVQHELQRDSTRKFRLAWFDAWKYEKEDALWRALLLRVIDNLRDRNAVGKDETQEPFKTEISHLEERLYRDVEWQEKGGLTIDLPKLAGGIAAMAVRLPFALLPGVAAEAVKAAQSAIGEGKDVGSVLGAFDRRVIEHHQAQLRSIEQFQEEFGRLVQIRVVARDERLVVFVDDLDRCLPDKAIEVLEAIKLFLDVKGCIFLLGLDQEVVTRGIKVKYRDFAVDEGEGSEKHIPIDGANYLEKIIQLPFRLPKIEPRAMQPFVHGLAAFPDNRCERIFAEGLETNPRKVKRAINVFLFLSKLAEKREITLQAVRLAKIVVIYHSHPELYELLRVNPALLRDLEEYLRAQAAATPDAERGLRMDGVAPGERTVAETRTTPVPERLLTAALRRVLTLFLDDENACFIKTDYGELNSYFTLTRGAIAEAPPTAPELRVVGEGGIRVGGGGLELPIPTFVRISAGEFLMGTSDEEIELLLRMTNTKNWAKKWKSENWFKREQPQHRVTLDEFQIAKYPVTNAQYQGFVEAARQQPPTHWSGGRFPEELAAHPVVNVGWDDAMAYCEWLTEELRKAGHRRVGEVVCLPTEAQWEKAASWDDDNKAKRIWAWGSQWDAGKCNTGEGNVGATTPVGKYSPEGDSYYGIADVTGNVWEWCADWFDEDHYKQLPARNPTGPSSGQYRVLRGGSWFHESYGARCALRFWRRPSGGLGYVGFRCARSFPVPEVS